MIWLMTVIIMEAALSSTTLIRVSVQVITKHRIADSVRQVKMKIQTKDMHVFIIHAAKVLIHNSAQATELVRFKIKPMFVNATIIELVLIAKYVISHLL